MNTPLKKRYSSASEYGTPVSDESENSLYFSFSVDEYPPNKENTSHTPSSSIPSTSKAKTPLLRKVLQSNFTPRNANNKRVSFNHLPKQIPVEEKMAKTTDVHDQKSAMNSNAIFDLKPISEYVQKIIEENNADQDVPIDDDDEELHNTIIENYSSVKLSEANKATESKTPKIENDVEKKMIFVVPARNVTKNENRKSVLPVAKKSLRATTYKRRSSTYEPRKLVVSKSVSGIKI